MLRRIWMHEHFDGQRAFQHIENLSVMRRLSGTAGEADAREYIHKVGNEMGVEMRAEEFFYSAAPLRVVMPLIILLLAAVSVVGSLTYLWDTPLTAITGAVMLTMIYVGFKWSGGFEWLAGRGGPVKSANLIGEISGKDPKGTIVLSAHYDSKSQIMPVVVRATFCILGYSTAILLGTTLVVVGIMRAAGKDVLGNVAGFYATLVPAFFLFVLAFNLTGNRSPGALDNASGEAVILEMARALKRRPLESFDVRIASFGCEEVGLCGSINYLLVHEEELKARPFYMLNFDVPFSPGGTLALNTGFEIPPRLTSRHLNELAERAALDMGFEIKEIFLPIGAAADHMPFSKHGLEATGFVSASAHVHRASDSIDKINSEGLRRTGEVALAVVHALDQEMCAASSREAKGCAADFDLR
jgi:hypothetical protein